MSLKRIAIPTILLLIGTAMSVYCYNAYSLLGLFSPADALCVFAPFIACAIMWQIGVEASGSAKSYIIAAIAAVLMAVGLGIMSWIYIAGAKAGVSLALDAFMAFIPFLCGAIVCLLALGRRSDVCEKPMQYFGVNVEEI